MQPSVGAQLPRPAAVLKDWDGTIVDSLAHAHATHNRVLRELSWPEVDFLTTVRMTGYGAAGGSKVLGLSASDNEKLQRRFAELFFVFDPDNLRLMEGAKEFMAALGESLPLGVVSNKEGTLLRQEIAHLGWSSRIKSVVAHGEAGANKPSPVPLLTALQQLGITASKNVWFVGDTPSDIECALAAGVTSVLVTSHRYDGPKPCFTFPDLRALTLAYHEACKDDDTLHPSKAKSRSV